jgi:hypothetical protein
VNTSSTSGRGDSGEHASTARITTREAFEAFHAQRKSKGAQYRENLFGRLNDGSYADDSVQRHWWTWQNAQADIDDLIADLLAALQGALMELREYEFDASGETYSNPRIDAAIAKATGGVL